LAAGLLHFLGGYDYLQRFRKTVMTILRSYLINWPSGQNYRHLAGRDGVSIHRSTQRYCVLALLSVGCFIITHLTFSRIFVNAKPIHAPVTA